MNTINIILISIILFLSQSCAVLNPRGEKLIISAKWNRQLDVQPMDKKDTKVFLRTKNSSGSEVGQKIKKTLKLAILEEGYLCTSTNTDASITVRADINYFGESQGDPVHYGKVIGGLTGAGAGAAIGRKAGSTSAGAIGGGIIGVGLGSLIDLAGRTTKLDLVATVTVWQNGTMQKSILVVSAEKRNLTIEEAMIKLVPRMSIAISNILP